MIDYVKSETLNLSILECKYEDFEEMGFYEVL